jgi:hypothetical protein
VKHSLHPCWGIAALLAIVPLTGCAKEGPERVEVEGRITFGGGSWPKPGVIYFTPLQSAPGMTLHPGLGYFDTHGAYQAQTFEPGDGLVPGKYRVRVECWEVEPSPDPRHGPAKSYVPASTKLPDLEIAPGSSALTQDFDVPKR